MGKIVKNGVTYSGSSDNADNVKYNNNVSNLDATNVQEAIDKLNESVDILNDRINRMGWKLSAPTNVAVVSFDEAAKITWTDPDDVVINGGIAATWAGTKVIRKEGSAPTSPTDGVEVVNETTRNQYQNTPVVDTGLTNGVTYYYGIFPYTDLGVYNLQSVTEVTPREYVQFAFHYSENDSSPASVTYPAGYDNSNYTDPFYVDLSTGVPHYGDWDKTNDKNKWLFPKPCMLKYDGTVDYYLNENDETKKEDGTPSDVANSSYAGNAMVEWGQDGKKLYWKIVPDSDDKGFTFVIASAQVDNDMQPWNHYNCKGEIAEHFYTPIYFGSSDGTRLRSISGGTNYVNNAATAELTLAKANNLTSDEIWNTEVYCDFLLTAMLCILISKSTNSQAKFGYGRCAKGNTSAIGQGTMNGKGMFFGKSDQTSGVKVFGMENPWGNLWRRIAGLIDANGTVKLKLTYGKQDGSTVEGYNTKGSGYISHGTMAGTSGGYTSHMNITNRGITPETISGSDSTYYCDGAWFNNGQVDYELVGGNWSNGLPVGCLCVGLSHVVSYASASAGAALSCKPLA